MADQNVKISELSPISDGAVTGDDIVPVVDSGTTKSLTLTQVKNYVAGFFPTPVVNNTTINPTTVINTTSGSTALVTFYYVGDSPPNPSPSGGTGWNNSAQQPQNGSPNWLDHTPSAAENPTSQIVWSVTGMLTISGTTYTGLAPSCVWSQLSRIGNGSVPFFSGTQPTNTGNILRPGDVWYNLSNGNKLYRWTGSAWTPSFTVFPNLDVNSNFAGFVKTNDTTESYFAIVADNFQIVDPANPGSKTSANVPFEIIGGAVYIKTAHIQSLDAAKITSGTINAAIKMTAADLNTGKICNGFSVYNNDASANLMPVTTYGRDETITPYSITGGPSNPDGGVNWLSNNIIFYGWSVGSGYLLNRFGKSNMIFNYTFEGYASDSTNGINLNVVYQINGGDVTQAQFPQADTAGGGLRLTQSGSVFLTGLNGTETIKFGYRAASTGSGSINYSQLTVTGFNM